MVPDYESIVQTLFDCLSIRLYESSPSRVNSLILYEAIESIFLGHMDFFPVTGIIGLIGEEFVFARMAVLGVKN